MISSMRELWEQAQAPPTRAERLEKILAACAVAKAAPYIHPRLAAVATTTRQRSVRDLSDAELGALIQSMGGEVIDPGRSAGAAGERARDKL